MTHSRSFHPEGAEALGQRYEVLRQLREEPWGGVWLAQDRLLGVEVALKIVTRDAGQYSLAREIFLQEAALAFKLRHPQILGVYYGSEVQEGCYLVEEPFPGESLLAALSRQHRFSLATALNLLEQIGRALAYAHELGVVHQALSPLHVLVAEDVVKVANFASPIGNADQAGFLELKAYTSPEVVQGEAASAASNIFCLGVLGFRMIAGSLPYPLTFDEPFPYRLEEPPLDLEEIPVPLQNLLLGCLALEPEDRLADGRAFLTALEQTRELWRGAPQEKWFPWQKDKPQPVRDSARKAANLMGKLWEQGKPLPGRLVSRGKSLAGKIGEGVKNQAPRLRQVPRGLWVGVGLAVLVAAAAVTVAPHLWRMAATTPPPPLPAAPALSLTLPSVGGPPVTQVAEPGDAFKAAGQAAGAPKVGQGPGAAATAPAAPGAAAAPAEKPKPAAREERYLVLVASYARYEQAQTLSKQLKSQNVNAGVLRTTPGGKTLYQVRVGPITGKKQAEEMAQRVKSRTGLTPKVVPAGDGPAQTARQKRVGR